jgi:hypothetical protein
LFASRGRPIFSCTDERTANCSHGLSTDSRPSSFQLTCLAESTDLFLSNCLSRD